MQCVNIVKLHNTRALEALKKCVCVVAKLGVVAMNAIN